MICKDKNRMQKDIALAVTPLLPSSYFCLEIQTPLPPQIVDVIYGWPISPWKQPCDKQKHIENCKSDHT